MADTLIKKFTEISKVDTEIAGGKGASLGEMTQAGIPVPDIAVKNPEYALK